ncbi:MAG: type 2 lantipeptide synthetase LanM family protein [Stigonema ocellatum SAG 48.90 = DSM 106950]|nr:type 2 lantipeptide synthetase LanM family protein [Stigonema ocellatum SAG 48.90 = DSM 106950]
MVQSLFNNSAWYRAATLKERIKSLHNKSDLILHSSDAAKQKLKQWKLQPPFTNTSESEFAQRLAIDEITENELLYLLSEPSETAQNHFAETPSWLIEIERAFSATPHTQILPSPESLPETKMAGLMYIIEPLIIQGYKRLNEGIETLLPSSSDLPFDTSQIRNILFANLPMQLVGKLSRTMVLELHVARLQGKLTGHTPQERFESFLKLLRQGDTAISLLQEYPVLARQMLIAIENWVTFSLEFLQHLCADWDEICSTFSPDENPGLLIELKGGVGDTHQGGRSVLIAKFSSGFQVVYKPRTLAVDVHFQELLNWINNRGNHPPFRTLKILERGTYGWVEFVSASGCSSTEEIELFYQRQGGYLAILYVLEATDFHSENLIAVGEHPILVDLEALFHPRAEGDDLTKSDELASYRIFSSVVRVNLLPQRLLSNEGYEGIDISGLAAKEGQLSPNKIPYLKNVGTDELEVDRRQIKTSGTEHLPNLNNFDVNAINHTEAVVTGFTNIYRLLLQHRDDLLAENSPLSCFAEDEVRVVMRSTRFYSLLLTESFHPDVLRDALDRDRLFERLWYGIDYSSMSAKIIPSEREQLWQGDIPIFKTRPFSRDLWIAADEKLVDFFDLPSMNLVRRRLQQMSEEDLSQQLWFTRASISTLAMGDEQALMPSYHITEPQTQATREQLLAAACSIGDRLEWLAIRGEEDVTWIGLSLINDSYWSLVPLDVDLYNGVPGVALFLAYLGKLSREVRYTELARSALSTVRYQIEQRKNKMTVLGFGGWGGVIYGMTQLSVLWNQPQLLDEAEEIVELLPELINKDDRLDIIGGAAGCIGALVNLYHCRASSKTLAAAIECGDRLIAQAKLLDQGIGWLQFGPKGTGEKPLAGFSHGGAGMAWALLKVFALSQEQRFLKAALDAIAYERSLFSRQLGNWRDLRGDESKSGFMTAWCNGATGIGLARLDSLDYLDDANIRFEIDTALQTTLAYGFGNNHSLCHGDLGNLDLFVEANLRFNDSSYKADIDRLTSIILESINKYGWLCGVPLGVETPGLMTGLAGIGYGLLRLAQPELVPSVLMLQAIR